MLSKEVPSVSHATKFFDVKNTTYLDLNRFRKKLISVPASINTKNFFFTSNEKKSVSQI